MSIRWGLKAIKTTPKLYIKFMTVLKFYLQGNYEVHLNMVEKATLFLGTNFFYGKYDFKVTAFNKLSNFFCVHSVIDIVRVSE